MTVTYGSIVLRSVTILNVIAVSLTAVPFISVSLAIRAGRCMCGQLPSSCFLAVRFITFCSIQVAMPSADSVTDECDALDCLILVTRLRASSLMSDGSCEV